MRCDTSISAPRAALRPGDRAPVRSRAADVRPVGPRPDRLVASLDRGRSRGEFRNASIHSCTVHILRLDRITASHIAQALGGERQSGTRLQHISDLSGSPQGAAPRQRTRVMFSASHRQPRECMLASCPILPLPGSTWTKLVSRPRWLAEAAHEGHQSDVGCFSSPLSPCRPVHLRARGSLNWDCHHRKLEHLVPLDLMAYRTWTFRSVRPWLNIHRVRRGHLRQER